MPIIPKIKFVSNKKEMETLGLGWKQINEGLSCRRDGCYLIGSDSIYVLNYLDPWEKLLALLHEIGHAITFRIPFYAIRDTINWFLDMKYNNSLLFTPLSEYLDIYSKWRYNCGRFPWIFGIKEWPEEDEINDV